jgi:DNA-binding CsgD family transcriptional regulator
VARPRTVVWLDDLDRYLRGGLTRARLQALLHGSGPVIILGTIRASEYHAHMVLPRPGEQDVHQRERDVLALATVIDVDATLSPAELHAAHAAAARDPSLAAALAAPDHGVFQNLAAGPHLMRRWVNAGNDYAKALITAAVDARRSGIPEPLDASLLRDATAAILTPSQQARADSDWLESALSYATTPVPGGIAALTPVSVTGRTGQADGYHVADFLVRHGEDAAHPARRPAGGTHPAEATLGSPGSLATPVTGLTSREREIAGLAASGLSNREIAARMLISKRTVDAHIEHVFGKLGISSRVQLAIRLRDMHPQASRTTIRPSAGAYEVSPNVIYRQLEEMGLAARAEKDGCPVFRITDAGRDELRKAARDGHESALHPAQVLALMAACLSPSDVADLVGVDPATVPSLNEIEAWIIQAGDAAAFTMLLADLVWAIVSLRCPKLSGQGSNRILIQKGTGSSAGET